VPVTRTPLSGGSGLGRESRSFVRTSVASLGPASAGSGAK
jgi:hypothetical protein